MNSPKNKDSEKQIIAQFDYSTPFLSFWVKENGRWQNIAYQSSANE
jgi:hypothetical protein